MKSELPKARRIRRKDTTETTMTSGASPIADARARLPALPIARQGGIVQWHKLQHPLSRRAHVEHLWQSDERLLSRLCL